MDGSPRVSVIIPALNESNEIVRTVRFLKQNDPSGMLEEVIVVDGGSDDHTPELAREEGAVTVESPKGRRSIQMNLGAEKAQGNILYFLHADCRPPETYLADIAGAVADGAGYGCFRRKIESAKKDLGFISFVSRFRGPMFRGGDASLFVRRDVFDKANGFKDKFYIMEDFEIMPRLGRHGKFRLLPGYVLASDRKHRENNHSWRVHAASILVFSMYYLGFSQSVLLKTYRKLVVGARYHK